MADGFNRFNTGGQFYFPNQNSSHPRGFQHRNGSPIGSRGSLFQHNADTPSPNRSPGTNSPASHPFGMYNQNSHRQNYGLLNGGAGHQSHQMNLHKGFQGQSHGHQSQHLNNHQDQGGIGGQTSYGNHQHNISASTLSNATPHFTPAHLQNGTPDNSGILSRNQNKHYAEHIEEYQRLKLAGDKPHYYARTNPTVTRLPGVTPSVGSSRLTDADEHGTRGRGTEVEESENNMIWDAMDLGGHGLKSMGASLFRHYSHLRKIYFNHNRLTILTPHISIMRNLTMLDLSMNHLTELPPEIGMLTNLKRLLLFENRLQRLPYEIGFLYQLDMLGLEGNPMLERMDQYDRLVESGTQDLVRYLREEAPPPDPPEDRSWHHFLDEKDAPEKDRFTVASWNTLCDRAATQAAYGYAPTEVLSWQRRRYVILDELKARDADILTLQEVDVENYSDFFAPNLASCDYKGTFQAKGRTRNMTEKEAKNVDGCATFWKASKFFLLQKSMVIYSKEAINRADMKGEHDVYNRVMPRDHIALITFLENKQNGSRLVVVNTHLTWEATHPDVKIVQVGILMDYLAKTAEDLARWPPSKDKDKETFRFATEDSSAEMVDGVKPEPVPSQSYEGGTQIPILVCGDFNSTHDSGVYDLITTGSLSSKHPDLGDYKYGDFTRNGMTHPFSLKSSYNDIGELPFTNWTPDFREVIDYIWYSTNTLQVTSLLGQVDNGYMGRVPGFPNYHFPSDHLLLMAEYCVKERKERKVVEADFGPSSRRGGG